MLRKEKIRKLCSLVIIGVLAGIILAGCGSASGSDSAGTDAGSDVAETASGGYETLRLGVAGSDDDYVMEMACLAYDSGYLEEELNAVGYTVEISAFSNTGTEVNEALASGDLDGAIYGDFPAFTSKSNGIDTTIIASVNQRMQYALLAADDSITSAADLEGKNVIVISGSVQQYFWEKYTEAAGIDADAVNLINSTDFASLIQTGSADAAAGNLYSEAYMESMGIGTIVDYGSSYDIYTTMVCSVKTELLEENPEIAVAVNKALIRAYEAALEDPQVLYEAVATSTMTADIMQQEYAFDESLWYMSPEFDSTTLEYYEELSAWMYENGLIQSEVDVSELVDTSYYETAAEELAAE